MEKAQWWTLDSAACSDERDILNPGRIGEGPGRNQHEKELSTEEETGIGIVVYLWGRGTVREVRSCLGMAWGVRDYLGVALGSSCQSWEWSEKSSLWCRSSSRTCGCS